jgi:hypothetical protein
MKINDDHMYHGAALTQIAEHPTFKAINAFWQNGKNLRAHSALMIPLASTFKYAGAPRGAAREYVFTFSKPNLDELKTLREHCTSVFVALICIQTKEICVISFGQLQKLVGLRKSVRGEEEDQYQILVAAPANKAAPCLCKPSVSKGHHARTRIGCTERVS